MNIFRKKTVEDIQCTVRNSALEKTLTAKDIACLGIGCVIGTGIFVVTGIGAHLAGPAVIVSFLLTGLISVLCGLVYAELASTFPVSGSTYSYCFLAFGEIVAWIVGWALVLAYLVNGSAVAAGWSGTFVGLLKTIGITLPPELTSSFLTNPSGGIDLPAVVISILVTYVLFIGVSESAKMNNLIVIVKVGVILLFVALGVSDVDFSNFTPFAPFGWSGIMAGAAIVFYSYTGFDAVSTAAEESVHPERDIPLGLGICLAVVIVLYIAVALVLTGIVPFNEIDKTNALPAALNRIGIHWGSALVAVGAIIGMMSALLAILYGQIRIFMVMARDGLLPALFNKVHPRYKTPYLGTWITGIVCGIIAGIVPLDTILEMANISTLGAFALVSLAVIVLRKNLSQVKRKFKCPLVPVLPLITIGTCLYVMASISIETWMYFIIYLVIGLAFYIVYGMKHSSMN